MSMGPILLLVSCIAAQKLLPQTLDWAKIFKEAVVRNRAINDRARDRMLNEIAPKLLSQDPSFASEEMPGIAMQLNSDDSGIRQQASGVLSVLAQFRPDSASVLSRAFPILMEHVHDPAPRVRINSLNALCFLRPEIPPEEEQFLIELINDKDERIAGQALFGIARMASLRAEAAAAIEKALSQTDSPGRKLAAIRALAAAHVTAPRLLTRLGGLLTDGNPEMVRAALQSIAELGIPAISANLNELNQLAETSQDKYLADSAKQLIERQRVAH